MPLRDLRCDDCKHEHEAITRRVEGVETTTDSEGQPILCPRPACRSPRQSIVTEIVGPTFRLAGSGWFADGY